jgi:uncharacterized protein YbbC (DUF1343 family)/CubicO group peptidase (beta-lactamase class C family)
MPMSRIFGFLALLSTPLFAQSPAEQVGMDPMRLDRIGPAIQREIDAGRVPGAVILVGRRDQVVYHEAFGRRAVVPSPEPMTRDTRFDMASLTKPIATATSVMLLIERGQVRLEDPITKFFPEMDNHGKRAITIEHLLRHRAGLIADNPIGDYAYGPEGSWKRIANIDLVAPPGERFLYSDVGFIILGKLVEKVSGRSLDEFARDNVFRPLGMDDTGFNPDDPDRVAPTEPDAGKMLRGVVHDPRARKLGGVAGHAGLFSTAVDLAKYARMLLRGGKMEHGASLLSPLTVRAMIDPAETPARQRRGLGWDVNTGYSAPRGSFFGPRSFGHTGFTGTSIWIDPGTETYVILLTSRLHPDGKGQSPTALRAEVATLAAAAIVDAPGPGIRQAPDNERGPRTDGNVRCGIDVLISRDFDAFKGKKVGLVTNHTGKTRDGRPTIDILANAPGVKLVALFSPEHGIRGMVDREVPDDRDEKTGLPIYSLYGKTRKPTKDSLQGVDTLVYDIQDIGCRFYTYISTLGLVLEAAAESGVAVVVLDRPNPIGGEALAGPLTNPGLESFVAYHRLPVRHGMTVGELARLFNGERKIGADLTVIPCQGWRRSDLYDSTGLLWTNPSPNMRSLTEALLYPGVGLLETTNLATGRGTDTPFERVGAPYIDPVPFATALNRLGLPGVTFVPTRFTPSERQFAGQECGGVYIAITDWSRFEPLSLGMGLATTLRKLYREEWKPERLMTLLVDRETHDAILAGKDVAAIRALWLDGLAEFAAVRAKYLIDPSHP